MLSLIWGSPGLPIPSQVRASVELVGVQLPMRPHHRAHGGGAPGPGRGSSPHCLRCRSPGAIVGRSSKESPWSRAELCFHQPPWSPGVREDLSAQEGREVTADTGRGSLHVRGLRDIKDGNRSQFFRGHEDSVGLYDADQERGVQMPSAAIKASSFPFPRQALPCTPPAAAHPVPHVPRLGELSQGCSQGPCSKSPRCR